ncbi:MAG: ATP-binding domain-containing protein, partial [bacterium]
AGSGKSILALWKAKQIQNERMGSWLFIVFTKALKRYMSDGIKEIGLHESNIENYHQCFFWSKNNGEWQQGEWKKGMFDYIIVDEAQDFSKEDILLFKSKVKKALLLYGDSAQQLYKFIPNKTTISMDDIVYITKYPTEQLVYNHRLPKKVARLAEYINNDNDELEIRCKNEVVENPKIIGYESFDVQLDSISKIIENRNFEDTAVLFRNGSEVRRAYNYFTNKGLSVEARFQGEDKGLNFTSSNPKLMTYHSSKGLQFEAVFLPECTSSDNDSRNPLYVALTRTYQSLYVMHSGNLSSFFDAVPKHLYDTTITANTELL